MGVTVFGDRVSDGATNCAMTDEDREVMTVALRLAGLCTCGMCAVARKRGLLLRHGTEPALDTTNATTAAVAPPNSGNQ